MRRDSDPPLPVSTEVAAADELVRGELVRHLHRRRRVLGRPSVLRGVQQSDDDARHQTAGRRPRALRALSGPHPVRSGCACGRPTHHGRAAADTARP